VIRHAPTIYPWIKNLRYPLAGNCGVEENPQPVWKHRRDKSIASAENRTSIPRTFRPQPSHSTDYDVPTRLLDGPGICLKRLRRTTDHTFQGKLCADQQVNLAL